MGWRQWCTWRDPSRFSQGPLYHLSYLYIIVYDTETFIKEQEIVYSIHRLSKSFWFHSHCKLWPILNKIGIKGKMLETIQSMYRIVKARIRNGNNVTSAFICQKGLKQGEITSPLLLLLFINELARDIIENGRHGTQLLPDMLEMFILLFADNIALLSDTIVGLQNQLDVLARNCARLVWWIMQDKSCLEDLGRFIYHSNKHHEVWPGPQQVSFPGTKV